MKTDPKTARRIRKAKVKRTIAEKYREARRKASVARRLLLPEETPTVDKLSPHSEEEPTDG